MGVQQLGGVTAKRQRGGLHAGVRATTSEGQRKGCVRAMEQEQEQHVGGFLLGHLLEAAF